MKKIAARFWVPFVVLLIFAGPTWGFAFTLQNSVAFDNGSGTTGTIDPVLNQVGSIDATHGTVTAPLGGPQDVFYFTITVTTGQIDFLGVTVGTPLFFVNPKGVGYLDGAGDTPSSIFADSFIDNAGEYTFAGSSLTAGETSRRLFLTHEPVGDISLGQTVQFMISDGLNFDVSGIVAPEPGTAALVGFGLLGMAVTARSRWSR